MRRRRKSPKCAREGCKHVEWKHAWDDEKTSICRVQNCGCAEFVPEEDGSKKARSRS